jgi:hypothetical protein
MITARTPTTGWRIYTGHQVTGDTVNVTVRGVPPSSGSINQVSHPIAAPIIIPDNEGMIRRVSVESSSGQQTVSVSSSGIYRSLPPGSGTRPILRRPPPQTAPPPETNARLQSNIVRAASSKPLPLVDGPPPRVDSAYLIDLIRQIREDFSESAGIWIKQDGNYQQIGQRDASAEEKRILEGLKALDQSVRAFFRTTNPTQRQTNAARISDETDSIRELWQIVKMSPELNQKFRNLFQSIEAMLAGFSGR